MLLNHNMKAEIHLFYLLMDSMQALSQTSTNANYFELTTNNKNNTDNVDKANHKIETDGLGLKTIFQNNHRYHHLASDEYAADDDDSTQSESD